MTKRSDPPYYAEVCAGGDPLIPFRSIPRVMELCGPWGRHQGRAFSWLISERNSSFSFIKPDARKGRQAFYRWSTILRWIASIEEDQAKARKAVKLRRLAALDSNATDGERAAALAALTRMGFRR